MYKALIICYYELVHDVTYLESIFIFSELLNDRSGFSEVKVNTV